MKVFGNLHKMRTELSQPVQYGLPVSDECIPLNPLIGKSLSLRFTGGIHCIHCGRKTSKSFNQGYCFPCFRSLARCDVCIIKPEQCHFHQGTCREPEWGMQHCMQPHYIYLANSSGVKVGITRHSQVSTRWIDQGAVQALPIVKVQSRFQAGLLEVAMKQYVSDRTSWQKMLKSQAEPIDLIEKREELLASCKEPIHELAVRFGEESIEFLPDAEVLSIQYPVTEYPVKVKSFNFDKTPTVSGTLLGIKGQYLIFDTGVINIRKFGGYQVEVS
jgi:Protein of unknown function (DUF2797)